jgi:hypothetical protein
MADKRFTCDDECWLQRANREALARPSRPDDPDRLVRRMLSGNCRPGADVHVRAGAGCQCGQMLVRR